MGDPLPRGGPGQPAAQRDGAEAERRRRPAGRGTASRGRSVPARWRIATNAEAHSSSVTPTAASGSHAGPRTVGSGALAGLLGGGGRGHRPQPRNRHRQLTRGYRTSEHDFRASGRHDRGWPIALSRRSLAELYAAEVASVRAAPRSDLGPTDPHRVDGARAAVPPAARRAADAGRAGLAGRLSAEPTSTAVDATGGRSSRTRSGTPRTREFVRVCGVGVPHRVTVLVEPLRDDRGGRRARGGRRRPRGSRCETQGHVLTVADLASTLVVEATVAPAGPHRRPRRRASPAAGRPRRDPSRPRGAARASHVAACRAVGRHRGGAQGHRPDAADRRGPGRARARSWRPLLG